MSQTSHIPVLVVGSGAAGTMLALELARRDVNVRIIDRLERPSPFSRAVTVHARTLEILELIDPVLATRFVERGVHSPGYVMHFVDESGRRREVRPGLDFRELPSRYPYLLLHSQDETEAALRRYLKERFGRETDWGWTCTAVKQVGDEVEATLCGRDGTVEVVRCQYLAACDGAGSRIRQQLGLAQEGSDYAGTVLQNLDVELLDFPDDARWVHYCMGPAHFVMVASMQNGFTRLLMSQPADRADAAETPQSAFLDILTRHFDGIRFGRTSWHSRWASHVRLATRYRHGNVFLLGDAAHVHSTAGGQGMNCCMQDAFNLGWKLAMVLKGQAHPALLDSYESERRPIGRQVIEAASRIHELFMAGRSSGAEALLAMKQSGALAELVGRVSGLAYHYRREEDAAAVGEMPAAGDRLPNLPLEGVHRGRWLVELLRHEGFTWLECAHQPEELEASPGARPGVTREVLSPAPAALLPAGAEAQVYVLRPDGYVAGRFSLREAHRASSLLDAILA